MNKEEMLNLLKNIQEKMSYELENDNMNNRIEEIDQLQIDIPILNSEIRELENKINNDTNYTNNYAVLSDEAIGYIFKSDVNRAKSMIAEVNKNIAEANERIAQIDEIGNKNTIEEERLNEENLINGQLLREIGENPNPEDEEIIRNDFNNNRERLAFLSKQNQTLSTKIDNEEKYIVEQKELLSSYEKDLEISNKNLENFNNDLIRTPLLNEAKRLADKKTLENLVYERDTKVDREKVLSLNYYDEFSKIVNDLSTDVISVEESRNRIANLMNNIPERYFIDDIASRDKELEKNKKAQTELENKIKSLELKLSDDKNYQTSLFVEERNKAELNRWETLTKKVEAEHARLNEEKDKLEAEEIANNSMIIEIDENLISKGRELRLLGNNISQDDDNRIRKELQDLRTSKEEYNNNIVELKKDVEQINKNIAESENKTQRYNNVLNSLKESLEKRNNINFSQKRLDQIELSRCKSSLEALKNREKFVENSVLEEMTNVVQATPVGTVNDIPTQNIEEEVVENQINSVENEEAVIENADIEVPVPENVTENASIVENENQIQSQEITKDEKDDLINLVTKELETRDDYNFDFENQEEKETPLIENNEKREVEDTQEIEMPKGKYRFKVKEAKDKLVKKAKSTEFKKKLGKFAKRATAIALALSLSFGGYLVGQKIYKKINNPKVIEQLDDGSKTPEDIIKETIEENPVIEEKIEEEVKEEEKTPETPNQEQTNSNNTINGGYNKPNNNTGNNSNNSNNGNSHDNSNDISVPETPKEEEQPELDEDFKAPDAEIEDLPELDEDITIEDAEVDEDITIEPELPDEDITIKPEVPEGDITITPEEDEDIKIEDVEEPKVEDTDDEIIFDNKDEVEDSYQEDQEEDIKIEDVEEPKVEVNDPPVVDEDIKIEDSKDEVITNPVEPNIPSHEIEVPSGESFSVIENGNNYTHDNSDGSFNNLPNNGENQLDITENPATQQIIQESNSDKVVIESEKIEREHELTKEELQQLREEFANLTGNDVIEDSKAK